MSEPIPPVAGSLLVRITGLQEALRYCAERRDAAEIERDRLRADAQILHLHLGMAIGLLTRVREESWDSEVGIMVTGLIAAENKRRYLGKDGELVVLPVVPTQAIIDALVDGNEDWTGEQIWQRVLRAAKGEERK